MHSLEGRACEIAGPPGTDARVPDRHRPGMQAIGAGGAGGHHVAPAMRVAVAGRAGWVR